MTPLIEARSVQRNFNAGPHTVNALRDVSVSVASGGYLAITGPSGSGKSTLLALLGLLDRPTSGYVAVNGTDTSNLDDDELSALRREHFGFVFQQFHLLAHETALENVAGGLMFSPLSGAQRLQRAQDALCRVGLRHRLHHRPGQLSGGEQQRAAIARALCRNPAVLLADEPTGNLDQETGSNIVELLEEINSEGQALVVITHDHNLASRAHTRIDMQDGRLREVVA